MNQETPAAEPMGQFDRLAGALFDPKPAFADIAARPGGWWLPLVLLVVSTVGFVFAFTQHVGWERFMRQELAQSEQVQQMSVEQQEQILEQQLQFVPLVAHIQSVLAWPIVTLAVGGVFIFVFNVLLGSQLSFRQVYAIVCYGFLPQVLGGVLATGVMFLKDPAEFDLQNPVASNLGVFLDPSTDPAWLISLLGSVDAFSIWVLLLLATGFSAAARKIAWSKAFTWVVLTWVLFVAVKGAWAWIWS